MRRFVAWLVPVFTVSSAAAPEAARLPATGPADQPARTLHVVATAHLDTQWLWTIQDSISQYVPQTLTQNFERFEKFPNYVFSFEGAFRYMLAREYCPAEYETLKRYVAAGRWHVCGSVVDAGDVNIPSPEALVRQILYGNGFFKRELGRTSCDIFLPDCFGFGYALPAVAAHCGLRGFSTQKLTWGSSVGIPFDVGVWEGVGGSTLIAALNPGDYVSRIREDLSENKDWLTRIDKLGGASGAYVGFKYFGVGDQGGAPDAGSVEWLEKSIAGRGPIRVVSAPADRIFRELTPQQVAKLPRYKGELLMTRHGTGCYTSQAVMKRWNRRNEQLADAAECACVIAETLGVAAYPRDTLRDAWFRLLWHHHHDDLTGTSIPQAYTFSWNDELICLNQFAAALTDAVGAIATTTPQDNSGNTVPLTIFNPLSIEREEVVEATVRFRDKAPARLHVEGQDGRPVPAQVLGRSDRELTIALLARAPSVGLATYYVRPDEQPSAAAAGELSVTPRSLENRRYRVRLDDNGDVADIFDKQLGRELLASPIRLQLLEDAPDQWPEWEITYKDICAPPRAVVGAPAQVRVIEDGPARVAVEVVRHAERCTFVQRILLAAGDAGDRVEFDNRIDWRAPRTLLKAVFTLAAANKVATYDLGLGTIERGNNREQLYEVPAQQWAGLTDASGEFGVAVANDCKYGWDKPDDRTLRLTLVHSPHNVQKDMGTHKFRFAVIGHKGDWRDGNVPWVAARFNQPLMPFQGDSSIKPVRHLSSAEVSSPQVAIRALKKSEETDEVIVRLQELYGRPAKAVTVRVARGILSAREVTGAEEPLDRSVLLKDGLLVADLEPYQLRTFAITLRQSLGTVSVMPSHGIPLPFDCDVVSREANMRDGAFDAAGHSLPGDLWPAVLTCAGVRFELGPSGDGRMNAVTCRGQKITLDNQARRLRRLYLLAAADGDTTGDFLVGRKRTTLRIADFTGFVGQWHSLLDGGRLVGPDEMAEPYVKRDRIAWIGTHRHSADGKVEPYVFCYLFMYGLELPDGAETITLPDNPRIRILAASAAPTAIDGMVPAGELYDDILMPRISPRLGLAIEPVRVTIACDEPEAEIRYTTDGSEPTRQSPRYSGPLTIDRDAVVQARAYLASRSFDYVARREYRIVEPRRPDGPPDPAPGLAYEYCEGWFSSTAALAAAKPANTGVVDAFARPPGARAHDFGLRFEGFVQVPRDGVYVFYLRSDDGSVLFIGDRKVVDNDGLHGTTEARGAIALGAGRHAVRVLYFQDGGDAVLEAGYEGPGLPRQAIPPSALSHIAQRPP